MKKLCILALLATATATPAVAQTSTTAAISPLGPNSALLSLSAEGQSRRTPDLAIFTAGVVSRGTNAAQAMAANSRQMDAVVSAVRRAGIPDRDIQTSSLSLQPVYSNPEAEAQMRAREMRQPYIPPTEAARIIGYEARNSVSVRVRRLGEMGRIIDTLVAAGANEVNGPSFTLDRPQAAQDEARAEAIAVGRQRAELYARAAGMRVARILSISEGGGYYPVQQIFATARGESDRGMAPPPPPPTPIAPGEVSLGVNVSMQFELTR
jgi:hypothetical protein